MGAVDAVAGAEAAATDAGCTFQRKTGPEGPVVIAALAVGKGSEGIDQLASPSFASFGSEAPSPDDSRPTCA